MARAFQKVSGTRVLLTDDTMGNILVAKIEAERCTSPSSAAYCSRTLWCRRQAALRQMFFKEEQVVALFGPDFAQGSG